MIQKTTYDAAQITLPLSTFRYSQSPYLEKYYTPETVFAIYCERFYPINRGEDLTEFYWRLRREAVMYDVPEKPLQIKGPDAVALLERVFTCNVASLKVWRARYGIACREDGTVLMDGVLIRLAEDHFWYVKANGEFMSWLQALALGMDVEVSDPDSRVLQIQGPNALKILDAAIGGGLDPAFRYFHAGMFNFNGQELLVTRTGWTGEMGIEIYSNSSDEPTDHHALWDHLIEAGKPFGMQFGSGLSMAARRIEAGILDTGSDIEPDMTPYEAGLSAFVKLEKHDFIGKSALETASRTQLLFGLTCDTIVPTINMAILQDGNKVGKITVGTYSPTLEKGVGYARFYQPSDEEQGWLGQSVTLRDHDGNDHDGSIVVLPFIDIEKQLPRGK